MMPQPGGNPSFMPMPDLGGGSMYPPMGGPTSGPGYPDRASTGYPPYLSKFLKQTNNHKSLSNSR